VLPCRGEFVGERESFSQDVAQRDRIRECFPDIALQRIERLALNRRRGSARSGKSDENPHRLHSEVRRSYKEALDLK
jgi:hypothetical protein